MNIMVSVLCLTYNHERYIRQCLEGFVMQKTDFPFEVLVHDDASTDHTADIIREYEKKYPSIIKPIYQKENQYSKEVKISSKFLIPRVKGKYIALCEGDDFWTDEFKLQKQYEAMEKHPECCICTHMFHKVDENGEYLGPGNRIISELKSGVVSSRFVVAHAQPPMFQTASYFMRKTQYIEYITTDLKIRKIPHVGDLGLLLYFCQLGPMYFIQDTMSCYRVSSVGSWTMRESRVTKKNIELYSLIKEAYIEYDNYTNGRFHEECVQEINKCNEYVFLRTIHPIFLMKKENRLRLRHDVPSLRERGKIYIRAFFPSLIDKYEETMAKKRNKVK